MNTSQRRLVGDNYEKLLYFVPPAFYITSSLQGFHTTMKPVKGTQGSEGTILCCGRKSDILADFVAKAW